MAKPQIKTSHDSDSTFYYKSLCFWSFPKFCKRSFYLPPFPKNLFSSKDPPQAGFKPAWVSYLMTD